MRYCERCRNEITGNSHYCTKCGAYVGIKYCPRCGTALNANAHFCPKCGMQQVYFENQKPQTFQNNTQVSNNPATSQVCATNCVKKKKSSVIGLLVWSLLLVAFINPLGTVLGAISSIYLISANCDEDDESRSLKTKKSLILCILATVFDILSIIVLIINLSL